MDPKELAMRQTAIFSLLLAFGVEGTGSYGAGLTWAQNKLLQQDTGSLSSLGVSDPKYFNKYCSINHIDICYSSHKKLFCFMM